MTSQTNENALLKAGCILLMAAGAVCQGISVWNSLSVGRQTQNMEPEIYDTLNQAMQQQTGGQAGADVAIQALQGLSVVMAVLCVVVLAVLLVVGLMGLKRIDKPEKYRFFLIWRIVLLVFGGIGALLVADFVSIRGIANLLWAVAAPIRFIVGALEKKSLGPIPKDRNPCINGTAAGGYRRLAIGPAGAL